MSELLIPTRVHVWLAERYGRLSGRLLLRCARHAAKANDYLTVLRCREIAAKAAAVGWSPEAFDNGDVIANRPASEALRILGLER